MASYWNTSYDNKHPGLTFGADEGKGSFPSAGNAHLLNLHAKAPPIYEKMVNALRAKDSQTRQDLEQDVSAHFETVVHLNLTDQTGWQFDLAPVVTAPGINLAWSSFDLDVAMMDKAPEGAHPQIIPYHEEEHHLALARWNLGAEQRADALFTEKGQRIWELQHLAFSSAWNLTAKFSVITAILSMPAYYRLVLEIQGKKLWSNVNDYLAQEISFFGALHDEKGIYKLHDAVKNSLRSIRTPQTPFDMIVLPFAKMSQLAYQGKVKDGVSKGFETELDRRGEIATRTLVQGGAPISNVIPGVDIYEDPASSNYAASNMKSKDYESFGRIVSIGEYVVISGLEGLHYNPESYNPTLELSVQARNVAADGDWSVFTYEQALDASHRWAQNGTLHKDRHARFLRGLKQNMSESGFRRGSPYVDPYVWSNPEASPNSENRQYYLCDLWGDVADEYRKYDTDRLHGVRFNAILMDVLTNDDIAKLDELERLRGVLEQPPDSLWGDDAMEDYVDAAEEGFPQKPDNVDLPYGFTTEAGLHALHQAYLAGGKGWDMGRELRIAYEGFEVKRKIWAVVKRIYPHCVTVKDGRYASAWEATENKDLNAFFATFSAFYDSKVRFPVLVKKGARGDSAFKAADRERIEESLDLRDGGGSRLAAAQFDALLDMLNDRSMMDDRMRDMLKADADKGGLGRFADAYRNFIGGDYAEMRSREGNPNATPGFGDFFMNEVAAEPEGKKRLGIFLGILGFSRNAIYEKENTKSITRAQINSYGTATKPSLKRKKGGAEPPAHRASIAASDWRMTKLSFVASVWSGANARTKLNRVAPADPGQRYFPLDLPAQANQFARAGYTEGRPAMRRGMRIADPPDMPSGHAAQSWEPPSVSRLASLYEYEEDQIFPPSLYEDVEGPFYVRGADSQPAAKYYLRARVEYLRAQGLETFVRMGAECMIFSEITKGSLMAIYRNGGVPPALCFVCARPFIRLKTLGGLWAVKGSGNIFEDHKDVGTGYDVGSKVWKTHFSAWMEAHVPPKMAVLIPDLFFDGYQGGYDFSTYDTFDGSRVTFNKSMFVFDCGANFSRDKARETASPMSLFGKKDPARFAQARFTDDEIMRPSRPDYPSFFFENSWARFSKLNKHKYDDGSFRGQASSNYNPALMFFGKHKSWSDQKGGYERVHRGEGFLKNWNPPMLPVFDGKLGFQNVNADSS